MKRVVARSIVSLSQSNKLSSSLKRITNNNHNIACLYDGSYSPKSYITPLYIISNNSINKYNSNNNINNHNQYYCSVNSQHQQKKEEKDKQDKEEEEKKEEEEEDDDDDKDDKDHDIYLQLRNRPRKERDVKKESIEYLAKFTQTATPEPHIIEPLLNLVSVGFKDPFIFLESPRTIPSFIFQYLPIIYTFSFPKWIDQSSFLSNSVGGLLTCFEAAFDNDFDRMKELSTPRGLGNLCFARDIFETWGAVDYKLELTNANILYYDCIVESKYIIVNVTYTVRCLFTLYGEDSGESTEEPVPHHHNVNATWISEIPESKSEDDLNWKLDGFVSRFSR